MNVVQQLPQPQHLNIMELSIFPDSIGLSKNSTKELTLETNCYQDVCNLSDSLSGEAAKTKYLLTLI